MTHPAVREACVFGLPDHEWGQTVAAAVITRAACDPKTLLDFLRGKMAGYKLPRQIYFLDSLPHTASGKLKRAECAAIFLSR